MNEQLLKDGEQKLVKEIGHRIRALRMGADMAQSELAYRANISSSMLSDVENGKTRPSITTLFRLSKGLEVDLCDLLEIKSKALTRKLQ